MSRQYVERRLYFSGNCEGCGKPFKSFKRARIKAGKCAKCRRNQPDPNQQSLFVGPGEYVVGGDPDHTLKVEPDRIVESIKKVPTLILGKLK